MQASSGGGVGQCGEWTHLDSLSCQKGIFISPVKGIGSEELASYFAG
jgi:hypothetical protein